MAVRTATSSSYWRDYILTSRWFQGKGLPLGEVMLTDLPWYVSTPSVQVRSELARVDVDGVQQCYHLLVGYLPPGEGEPQAVVGQIDLPGRGLVDVVDVPQSPRATAALLEGLTSGKTPGLTWRGAPPDPHAPTAVFEGEQSNTTIRIGDDLLFKVFRRLDPGPNLEALTLAKLADCDITPELVGVLSSPDHRYDLGIFVERVDHEADGWGHCVRAGQAGRAITTEMSALGATLRDLHHRLAQAFGVSSEDTAAIGADMLARLDSAVLLAPELAEVKPQLKAILTVDSTPIATQRVHGDFHLGQALRTPTGWTIIDFEGEPLKTPAERAAPDTVWRDVAGLLRSLDYARETSQRLTRQPLDQWYQDARRAFLAGYLEGADLPTRLLTAYEVDKAVYELLYEIRNRPSWASIPRRAIRSAITRYETEHN
ncbi:MAG: phosphotransferase [Propionibacteriaceae bacterium]|jgi:maltokinase|nr:phosphotransferase [Propionibacteriaceae bacterium]